MALDSEKLYLREAAELRLCRGDVRSLQARLHGVQAALEQRTAEWQIAEVSRQQLERLAARRSEQHAVHAMELIGLQVPGGRGGAGPGRMSYMRLSSRVAVDWRGPGSMK